MGHAFEERAEFEVDADPEQVWEAIATGPGMDSWYMGRNEVEPGEGGTVRVAFGGYTSSSTITAWEPGRRLAYHSDVAEDGRFIAFEFLIEGRDRGSTVVRVVTSGFLPGDDWEDEFESMTLGGQLFLRTLAVSVTHFAGRTATVVTVFGPPVPDWDRARGVLSAALGSDVPLGEGDRVRVAPDRLAPIDGVVYFANAHTLGIRTGDALYRFVRGLPGTIIAMHQIFADGVDPAAAERAWRAWLDRLYA